MTRTGSRWTPMLAVLGFLAVLGCFEATSLYIDGVRNGRTMTLGRILAGTLPSWMFVLALLWPVRWLTQRARIEPGTWARRLPIHVLAGALFALVTMAGTATWFKLMGRHVKTALPDLIIEYVVTFAASQIALYAAIVGMFHALDYLSESQQLERERARLAMSLAESRLNALRSQLRPHFFFNTLNAISTFALQGRPRQVGDMVGALGDLVRASLDDRLPHEIPLQREVDLLELYLGIQRMRFDDWLVVERDIDPATHGLLIPSLILQPLVENAIEHGGTETRNVVRIRCAREDGMLAIEIVSPDGDAADAAVDPARIGVGLRNTRERLEQLYPGAHEFRFGTVAGRGFVTALRIPARQAPREAAGDRGPA